MRLKKNIFSIPVNKYVSDKIFEVHQPASVDNPKNNSVMFLMERMKGKMSAFLEVKECLIFWQKDIEVPEDISKRHAIVLVNQPRLEYCRFFEENGITNLPIKEKFDVIDGAFICRGAIIPNSCTIMPGAYIGGEVKLGEDCYIGCGTKLVGKVEIGDNVVIRENTVIGADGLSTDRDIDGRAITMPQFGGVKIEGNVKIGANVVIARGAIDDTVLKRGCKIDNHTFISHNVEVGEDTFIVGETIMFGSSKIGNRSFISGNSTIRNKVEIGDDVVIGMGSVVTKNVTSGSIVYGNPAKGSN